MVEAAVARVHFVAAMLFLMGGLVRIAREGILPTSLAGAFIDVVAGGFTILILGTSRMLLTGVFGLNLPLQGRGAFLPASLVAAGALSWRLPNAWSPLAWTWSAGVVLHTVIVATGLVRRHRARSTQLPMAARHAGSAAFVVPSALAYALASSALLPPLRTGAVALPVVVHLLLTGFVAATIAGVGLIILPRFTRRPVARVVAIPIGLLVLLGPALLALALHGAPRLLPAAAVVEAAGLGGFALVGVDLLLATGRPRHSFVAYLVACGSIITGLLLGLLFAFDPATRMWVTLHAVVNLFGFAGFFVIGAAIDLYGPTVLVHPRWLRRQSWATVAMAVAGLGALTAEAAGGPALGGAWIYAGAVFLLAAGGVRGMVLDARRRQV